MQRKSLLLVLLIASVVLLTSGCATTAPTVSPSKLGFLLDPRVGFTGSSTPAIDKRFGEAWTKLLQGFVPDADRAFASIEKKNPGYLPATVGRAVAAMVLNDPDRGAALLDKALGVQPDYQAAKAHRAEAALAKGDVTRAFEVYRALAEAPDATATVRSRYEVVAAERFRQLQTLASSSSSNEEAIVLLQQAVQLAPQSDTAREQLARRLIGAGRFAEARVEVTTLIDRGLVDTPGVQAMLADIESGEGRHQAAIIRLERLVKRYPGQGYDDRLASVKIAYKRANLPPRYNVAVSAPTLTRADLAILAYWEISAFRFAPIADPPIAVDIADVAGRDEIVQALGLRLLSVDPITRAVEPSRPVTAAAMLRAAGQLLRIGGAPPCAGNGSVPVAQALQSCGVPVASLVAGPDAPLSGSAALAILVAVENAKKSAE
ncbi:MAG: tetratricopeptide repeat protein [Thermoanaerobaculia bacterium]|nr:tetratricopeptide repeat protein [Thermoanaerobaculia bacterium]